VLLFLGALEVREAHGRAKRCSAPYAEIRKSDDSSHDWSLSQSSDESDRSSGLESYLDLGIEKCQERLFEHQAREASEVATMGGMDQAGVEPSLTALNYRDMGIA